MQDENKGYSETRKVNKQIQNLLKYVMTFFSGNVEKIIQCSKDSNRWVLRLIEIYTNS